MDTVELLKKIKRLEIKTRGLTKQVFSGEYHSAFKGKGMTFSEVRDYQLGDEVRTIDWNVTARFNSPFVKTFEEERELTVMLLIDISGSSDFGGGMKSKKELALEIAAVIAFSAVSNNDKVGAIFISDQVEKYISPEKGRKHALLILRELIEFQPKSLKTNLNEGLKFFRNTQKKRSISFVISDFMDDGSFLEGMKISRKKHDVVAIKLKDEADEFLMDLGVVQLFNAETQTKTWVDTSDQRIRDLYTNSYRSANEKLSKNFMKAGIDSIMISTSDDYILALMKLFKQRM
jgi:uncharacterized protein (DUF58 family)